MVQDSREYRRKQKHWQERKGIASHVPVGYLLSQWTCWSGLSRPEPTWAGGKFREELPGRGSVVQLPSPSTVLHPKMYEFLPHLGRLELPYPPLWQPGTRMPGARGFEVHTPLVVRAGGWGGGRGSDGKKRKLSCWWATKLRQLSTLILWGYNESFGGGKDS